MKNSKKGFTLIEVVVVLVILAFLAAIVVPSMIHYINISSKKACEISRSELTRYYPLYKKAYSKDTFNNDDFVNYVKENYGDPDTICPSGGEYTFKESNGILIVTCSKHSGLSGESALTALSELITQEPMASYFSVRSKSSVDSEAPTGKGMSGTASKVNELLKKMGVDTDNSSWQVYKGKEGATPQYYIYWSDTKISDKSVDNSVPVYRASFDKNGKLISSPEKGTCQVGSSTTAGYTYNIIDGTSFKK